MTEILCAENPANSEGFMATRSKAKSFHVVLLQLARTDFNSRWQCPRKALDVTFT
jgi:hypothetical protein